MQTNEGGQLGSEDIQYPVRTAVRTDLMQTNEVEGQLGIEDIRTNDMQTNEVEDQPEIEDVQYPVRTAVCIDLMQTNEVEDQLGIEDINVL